MSACDSDRTPMKGMLFALPLLVSACAGDSEGDETVNTALSLPTIAAEASHKRPARDEEGAPGVEVVGYTFEGELCPAADAVAEITRGRVFDLFVASGPRVAESTHAAHCAVTLELSVPAGFRFTGPLIRYQLESVSDTEWASGHGLLNSDEGDARRARYHEAGTLSLEERASDLWSPSCESAAERDTVRYRIQMTASALSGSGEAPALTQLSADFGLAQEARLEPCAAQGARSGARPLPKQPLDRAARNTPL